jgi:hypothetical protein
LQKKIKIQENDKKIPLLFKRPVYDEMKNLLGEAYVEEQVSINSSQFYDILETIKNYNKLANLE